MPMFVVASGSGENNLNNVAAALQANLVEPMDEPITWNWNPNAASRSHSESKTNQIDNDEYMASNGYGQSFNKLMGEFKRNEAAAMAYDSERDNKSPSKSKITLLSSPRSFGSGDATKRSNTAVIFNSIISNLNDAKSLNVTDADALNRNFNASDAPSTSSLDQSNFNSVKPKTYLQKRKIASSRSDQSESSSDKEIATNELIRMSLNNDLHTANSSFLQALNDLHLDYNDLNTNDSSERQGSADTNQLTSKKRYFCLQKQFPTKMCTHSVHFFVCLQIEWTPKLIINRNMIDSIVFYLTKHLSALFVILFIFSEIKTNFRLHLRLNTLWMELCTKFT